MNGRVYDYNVARFLSVDPFVHGGSQGINPYSYIMNNPLSGTDPTGYTPEGDVQTKTVMVSKTGSRIKHKVEVSASSNADGSTTVTFSGSNGAAVSSVKNSVSSSLSGAGYSVADIGSQKQIAKDDGDVAGKKNEIGAAASYGLVGSIDKTQLGNDEGSSHENFDEAHEFFVSDQSNMGEKVEFEDKYSVSIRNAEDHSKTYAPKVFDTFDEANKYAGEQYADGYEKVWVFGYHYGGKSTIYKPATFPKNGFTGTERALATLAHESRHYNRANPSKSRPHRTKSEHDRFALVSQQAVDRFRHRNKGEKR
jgi:hypothetical protein